MLLGFFVHQKLYLRDGRFVFAFVNHLDSFFYYDACRGKKDIFSIKQTADTHTHTRKKG